MSSAAMSSGKDLAVMEKAKEAVREAIVRISTTSESSKSKPLSIGSEGFEKGIQDQCLSLCKKLSRQEGPVSNPVLISIPTPNAGKSQTAHSTASKFIMFYLKRTNTGVGKRKDGLVVAYCVQSLIPELYGRVIVKQSDIMHYAKNTSAPLSTNRFYAECNSKWWRMDLPYGRDKRKLIEKHREVEMQPEHYDLAKSLVCSKLCSDELKKDFRRQCKNLEKKIGDSDPSKKAYITKLKDSAKDNGGLPMKSLQNNKNEKLSIGKKGSPERAEILAFRATVREQRRKDNQNLLNQHRATKRERKQHSKQLSENAEQLPQIGSDIFTSTLVQVERDAIVPSMVIKRAKEDAMAAVKIARAKAKAMATRIASEVNAKNVRILTKSSGTCSSKVFQLLGDLPAITRYPF